MRVLICLLLVGATPTLGQRLAIVPFSGGNAAAVRNQLITGLCDAADCVNTAKVTTGDKPDWKKAKKEALQFFVTGAVSKKGKVSTLTLEVSSRPGAPRLKKAWPLTGDALAPKTLQQVIEALKQVMAQPEPEPEAEPQPVASRPSARTTEAPKPSAKPAQAPVAASEPAADREGTPAVRRIPFIAVEAGVDLLNRDFSYVAPVTNLRKYRLNVFPIAAAKLELYPLALSRQDLLGGLGIEAAVAFAPWLRSRRESAPDDVYPTSTLRFDAGLSWRIMPVKTLNLSIIPLVGVRVHSFTVAPNAAGARLDLLPNLSYVGVRAGAGVEVGLLSDRLFFFGRFCVVPVLSSGEIISMDFFPTGSNLGLDGSAGIGVGLLPGLQVRAAFDVTSYAMTFKTEPTDAYIAQGAIDRYLGGTATLRYQY